MSYIQKKVRKALAGECCKCSKPAMKGFSMCQRHLDINKAGSEVKAEKQRQRRAAARDFMRKFANRLAAERSRA